MDIYLLERLHKLLHGPINVFDRGRESDTQL